MTDTLRIGVADDEPLMLTYYEKKLGQLGHEVVVKARDGDVLVEDCLQQRPDLVVTDIRMPKLDGIVAAERLWQDASIPAILVSAHHDPQTLMRAQRIHVLAFLVKPIKHADLEAAVAMAAGRIAQDFVHRPISDEELASLASATITGCEYAQLEGVQCTANRGIVTLSGEVATFYLKQLAQTLAQQVPETKRIDNQLIVGTVVGQSRRDPDAKST